MNIFPTISRELSDFFVEYLYFQNSVTENRNILLCTIFSFILNIYSAFANNKW